MVNFFQKCALAAPLISFAFAIPVERDLQLEKRQAINDGTILNYALTLEYLEAAFYREALANYSEAQFASAGFAGVRERIVEIGAQEETHAEFLAGMSFCTFVLI
jgi:hypothetical protein